MHRYIDFSKTRVRMSSVFHREKKNTVGEGDYSSIQKKIKWKRENIKVRLAKHMSVTRI